MWSYELQKEPRKRTGLLVYVRGYLHYKSNLYSDSVKKDTVIECWHLQKSTCTDTNTNT